MNRTMNPSELLRRLLTTLLPLTTLANSYGETYTWSREATSSARWNQVANYSDPRPPAGGPGASDNLIIASVAPITLAGSQQIHTLSSVIAGGEITSGTGSTSTLTIHKALELNLVGASLSLRNTSATDTTTVSVLGDVNIHQGSFYLGGSNSGSSLLGFTVDGTTTISGFLYQHRTIANGTALGTLHLLAGGSATLLHGGNTENDTFFTTVKARSLSGSGTLFGSNMTGTGTRDATLHLIAAAGESGTFSGSLRDSDSATTANTLHLIVGSGVRQTLSGLNSYSGTTTISEGTLTLSGSGEINASSAVLIENGGTLIQNSSTVLNAPIIFTSGTIGGSGTIAADLEVGEGRTLSPGESPGSQLFEGDQQWATGGNYNWQVLDAAGSAGIGFDTLEITGTLSLLELSEGNTFNLNLWSLASVEESGEAFGFSAAQSYSWLIARAGAIDFDTAFDIDDLFTIHLTASNGTDGFQNTFDGIWSVTLSGDGTSLHLNYTAAIPEPGALALLGGAAALLGLHFRRTRHA